MADSVNQLDGFVDFWRLKSDSWEQELRNLQDSCQAKQF